jgi:ribonuclease HII
MAVTFGVDESGQGNPFGPAVLAVVAGAGDVFPIRNGSRGAHLDRSESAAAEHIRTHPDISTRVFTFSAVEVEEHGQEQLFREATIAGIRSVAPPGSTGVVDERVPRVELQQVLSEALPDYTVSVQKQADSRVSTVRLADLLAGRARTAALREYSERYGAEVYNGMAAHPGFREWLIHYVSNHGALPEGARPSNAFCQDALAGRATVTARESVTY